MSEAHITEFFDLVDHKDYPKNHLIRLKNVERFDGFIISIEGVKVESAGEDDEGEEQFELVIQYDIVELPNDVDETKLTEDEKDIFESMMSDIVMYLLTIELENRPTELGTDDTQESTE